MATPENNYQVVYRGEYLKNFKPSGWVFSSAEKSMAVGTGWGEPMMVFSSSSKRSQSRFMAVSVSSC